VVQCPHTLNAATWHRQASARFPDLETSNYGPQRPGHVQNGDTARFANGQAGSLTVMD
jgi:hypothetical protein